MTNTAKFAIVGGVGAAVLVFLWREHGAKAAPGTLPTSADGPLSKASVAIPKARTKRTAVNTPTLDVSAPEEPFTQLQLDSAAALGYGNGEQPAAADADVTRALNEDLSYLGIGG